MINKKIDEISAKLETIKVLVQDNEYLKNVEKSCEVVNKRNQTLENRIQKAIEYIWSTKYEWGDLEEDNEDFDIDAYKLIDILEGGNKDIPRFEGTLEELDNLSIRGNNDK